ncbi:MAG: hypothetical protein ACOC1K_00030 [Nanoarchaeota archaeon]
MKNKRSELFYWLKQITQIKKEKLEDIDIDPSLAEDFKKGFNRYMILKFLAMNPSLYYVLDNINSYYYRNMSDIDFYKYLVDIIPIDKGFYRFIKSDKKSYEFDEKVFNELFPEINIEENEEVIKLFEKDIKSYLENVYGGK